MTEKEAIEILENRTKYYIQAQDIVAFGMAIKALKEIQQYRGIGTAEECREAVEKQKAKKPDYEGDGYDNKGELVYDTWICPCCSERYEVDYDDYEHCPKCGQEIDWSEEDEMKSQESPDGKRLREREEFFKEG
ncbi:hypothetical protein H8S37_04225 [Mediterraneibacter sp. NSJ-55]|uniref:Uncharacterized protein n=1 Tax=Mediterraneibacter hominis TaxID=2763054 RepID=A0A923RP65_9FIRM|nr:hypothetical protein [Mediterraneibacter hominis]MBC5688140.1 hypothetical protein [Mediterraneibacter hominis]